MKKLLVIGCLYVLLPLTLLSQSRKKVKGRSIHAATTFNYYPSLKPYKFVSEYNAGYNDLILTFITKNSGTFVIEEGDSMELRRTLSSHMPSQLVGVGASVQIKNLRGLFHEVSLTKLSFSKSNHSLIYAYYEGFNLVQRPLGYDENMFAFAFRYELGKYFGKRKDAKLRVGISGGIEPSYYHYKHRSHVINEYPLKANLLTVDISLIPMLSVIFSKKLSLDFKLVPNFLTADFGKMSENNPTVPISLQGGIRNYKSPDMTWAFSILLRFTVKEAKKKRGE